MKSLSLLTLLVLGLSVLLAGPAVDVMPPGVMAQDEGEDPKIELPAEIRGEPGDFITIRSTTNGREVKWRAITPGLNVFPADMLRDSRATVVTARNEGTYEILAYTALGDVPSEPAIGKVIVGSGQPQPDPPPKDPPPSGFGLAAQVPTWLASVPQSARSDQARIKTAMTETADDAGKFDSVADMQAGLGVKLGAVMQHKDAWNPFFSGFSAAMNGLTESGKISTTADTAKALREVAGAL